MGFEGHHTELQTGVPLVFQPGVALHAWIEARWSFAAVFGIVGQSVVLYLFCETGAPMMPVHLRSQRGVLEDSQVEVELWLHQVRIAALEHRPVHQSLVLCRMHPSSPVTEVGCELILCGIVHQRGVEGEESSIKLRGPFALGVAAQHIAEQGIVACDGEGRLDIAALPELLPPLLGLSPVASAVHLSCSLFHLLQPVVDGSLQGCHRDLYLVSLCLLARGVGPSLVGSVQIGAFHLSVEVQVVA